MKKTLFIAAIFFSLACDPRTLLSIESPNYVDPPTFEPESKKWISANISLVRPLRFVYGPSISHQGSTIKAWTLEASGGAGLGMGRIYWHWLVEYSSDFEKYRIIKSVIQYPDRGTQTVDDSPNEVWRSINDDVRTLDYASIVKTNLKPK